MKSRSVFDLQDISAGFDTNLLPGSYDFGANSGGEAHLQDALPPATPPEAAATEHGSTNSSESASTAASFALLDLSADQGHQAIDPIETSSLQTSPGSGSIDVIGAPIQETSAGPDIGLHIAPLADSSVTATDALFVPAASALTPIASTNFASPTPLSFGHGVETTVGFGSAETVMAHALSGLDIITPATTGAISAGLAYLDNEGAGSPAFNSSVGSEGATAAQVQQALDESGLSVNGSGIKVGVLSDSFNDLGGAAADEADGALPSASNIQILSDLSSGGTDEGRAMMQIVHDIAPGSSLAFYTADNNEQDFANGILALAAAGCKVICDDVGYFDEPFFQNGVVAQAIQTVEAEGVTYVTAAGNEASNGYQAAFSATSGTFDGQTLINAENFGGSLTRTVTINTEGTGDRVPLILEWNQAYGAVTSSTADLKLLIFQNGSLAGTLTNTVDGEPTNPWIEADLPSGTYQIAIENMSSSGTDAGLIFKAITWGDGFPATISGSNTGTVVGHSMTPGAITAGAVSAADTPAFGFTPTSENFSSSGAGTELLFANNGAPLSSPDSLNPVAVSGIDDIATTVTGGLSDFYGTSAASASLAGVAALILAADPSLTPAEVETIMEQTALPMGNSAVSGDGLVQVDPAVAAALATHIVQTDKTTALTQVGNTFYLDNTGTGIGPELHYGGSVATAGEFGTYVPIGAVQVAGGDYDVAWHDPSSGLYSVWSVDSNGNYLSNLLSPVAGNSTALENFETIFNQDLNGDGSIGPPPPTTLSIDGTTTLVQSGTNYFLDVTGSSILGPELQRGGSVVTAGEFGTYVPIGAVQVAGGDYDVAWHDPSSGLYTVWSTDSNGNYLSNLIGAVAGNSTALENFETIFNQDLNGDGSIGPPPPTTLSVDGTTTLVQSGTNYFLDVTGSNILGPELHYGGSVVTAGEFGTYQPIDAVQVAGGDYDIAWHDPSSGLYSVWSVDSNGNYLSNLLSPVAGNSTALENFETTFNHDLNGDGSIGPPPPPPPTTLSIDGTTTLVQSGTHYFLDATGSNTLGPELQRGGSVVTAGEFGTYVPIGAVQVAGGGYDIAWHDPSSGLYTVWSVDSNGNYLSNLIGAVAGNSTALENFETVFNQDLNGDGTVGIYVAPGTTLQVTSSLPSAVGAATIGAAATLELAISDSASITFNSSTGMLKLDSLTAFTGAIDNFTGNGSLSGSDQIDLKGINFNSVHDSYSNGVLTVTDGTDTTTLDFNGTYSLANFKFASDSSGGTIVYDPPATAQPQSPTTAAHTANNPSHDSFVFAPILNHNSATDSHPAMDAGQFSPAASWNAATFLSETRDGPHGHAFMANSAHDAMPEQPLTAAQFYVHHGDFHFV